MPKSWETATHSTNKQQNTNKAAKHKRNKKLKKKYREKQETTKKKSPKCALFVVLNVHQIVLIPGCKRSDILAEIHLELGLFIWKKEPKIFLIV
jgi:hypothetical protein